MSLPGYSILRLAPNVATLQFNSMHTVRFHLQCNMPTGNAYDSVRVCV